LRATSKVKDYVKSNPSCLSLPLRIHSRTLGGNKWHIASGNRITSGASLIQKTHIEIAGHNNEIAVGHLSRLIECRIYISEAVIESRLGTGFF